MTPISTITNHANVIITQKSGEKTPLGLIEIMYSPIEDEAPHVAPQHQTDIIQLTKDHIPDPEANLHNLIEILPNIQMRMYSITYKVPLQLTWLQPNSEKK